MGFVSEPVNPKGVACWGFIIYRDGEQFSDCGVIGEGEGMSNNVAEYTALCKALQKIRNMGWAEDEILVKSDSRLLVNQMNGWWKVHGGLYYPAYTEAVQLSQFFPKISFVWVPREQNEEADSLSRKAYEDYCKQKGIKPKYHQTQTSRVKPNICMTCKWVKFSGPHIGCYKNYKYRGWLPKRFAVNSKCPDYERGGGEIDDEALENSPANF